MTEASFSLQEERQEMGVIRRKEIRGNVRVQEKHFAGKLKYIVNHFNCKSQRIGRCDLRRQIRHHRVQVELHSTTTTKRRLIVSIRHFIANIITQSPETICCYANEHYMVVIRAGELHLRIFVEIKREEKNQNGINREVLSFVSNLWLASKMIHFTARSMHRSVLLFFFQPTGGFSCSP